MNDKFVIARDSHGHDMRRGLECVECGIGKDIVKGRFHSLMTGYRDVCGTCGRITPPIHAPSPYSGIVNQVLSALIGIGIALIILKLFL
jgi:hypothetical protein